jgi:hypothetical protein
MTDLGRRAVLVAAGGVVTGGLAGCLEEGEEFLVTNTQIGVQGNSDILVRVTIENISDEQRSGLLEVILQYHADGDTDSDPDETWQKTEQLTVKQASSPQLEFVFESSYSDDRDIANYAVDASIDPGE